MCVSAMQVFGKASDGLCVHKTVMNLKLNYSLPGRKKKKPRTRFQKSAILEVLNMHTSG